MALIEHGTFVNVDGQPYQMQSDRTINEKNDGTLEGSVVFKCDTEDIDALPTFGSLHPDDTRIILYNASKNYGSNGILTMTGSYFGLSSPAGGLTGGNGRTVSFSGGHNNEPIETHPDFEDFAGTADNPLYENGALWDKVTGEFLGFDTFSSVAGVQYYLTPSTMISVSFWTDLQPILKKRMVIVETIAGVRKPVGVKDYLRTDTLYRQIGSSYQVTEQYLASGEDGWNPLIYPE